MKTALPLVFVSLTLECLAGAIQLPERLKETTEVPNGSFTLKKSTEGDFFITSDSFKAKGGTVYVVVSKVNPPGRATRFGTTLFDREDRPRSWAEADRTCRELKWADSEWHLPHYLEFLEIKLSSLHPLFNARQEGAKVDPPEFLSSYDSGERISHLRFFWTSAKDLPEEGLRVIIDPISSKRVSQTIQKPMNFFCVTYFLRKESLAKQNLGQSKNKG